MPESRKVASTTSQIRSPDQRQERRRFSVQTLLVSLIRPRRRQLRRQTDQTHPEWLDTLSPGAFLLGWLLFLLAMLDGLLTLKLLSLGASEANPFMRILLAQSPTLFLTVKGLLAAVTAVLLVRLRALRLRGRYPVAWLLYGWLALGLALVAYELDLLAMLS